ncbi:hypothetical protein EUGRSUZ_A00626 [Eucalyptus grandis]|uniref:Uncharacterized protein n=2 Tax=Eucalyptus grandis TaxID=71139 RepID=A0ACC3M2F0_EUCGR|nr:hypothetical protein EUGRSUZ_A00626 [Eucalyptus grandis]
MEPLPAKPGSPSSVRSVLVRALLAGVLLLLLRFAYVVTTAGESCRLADFCFLSPPDDLNLVISASAVSAASAANANANAVRSAAASPPRRIAGGSGGEDWTSAVRFYGAAFRDLASEGFLPRGAAALCVESGSGQDVLALKEIGVADAIGVSRKAARPLVISGRPHRLPFRDGAFDFVFAGGGRFDGVPRPLDAAAEISRTLKPEGYAVFHVRANDTYSFDSFIDLFNCCRLVRSRDLAGFDTSLPKIREIVLKKVSDFSILSHPVKNSGGDSVNKCSVSDSRRKLIRDAEPLIVEEPLKPWITLKRNIKNIKYLPSMVDISFRNRYVYVDVGARGYGSSIVSWFRKQYPKQNKTFEVYAIEADEHFYEEYKSKKHVTLLPYAAWVKNETLSFEINRDPGQKSEDKGRGMGRIQPVQSSSDGEVAKIQGFDFAEWLKNTVSEKDFVVMKMDVEGTEFDLIPRLIETGAICLIDELFLECHYNRWQRCCPGERSSKYEKTYGQCLDLFTSLRQSGVLVHQWW